MKEDYPFSVLLDEILSKRKEKPIVSLVKSIKKYPTLKRLDTLYDINHLAEVLFVFDEQELALQVSSWVSGLPITDDVGVNDCIKSALAIQGVIHMENEEYGKVEEIKDLIWSQIINVGDESRIRKRRRILDRILNGQAFNDNYKAKIESYRVENDKKGEASFQLMFIKDLAYMMVMGGSETYPVNKLQTLMKEMKAFISIHL